MADPLAGVIPGTTSPFVTSAATVNQTLDAVRGWRRAERGAAGEPTTAPAVAPAVTVWVRNDTGGALPVRSVVGLGAPLVSAADHPIDAQRQPTFPAAAPAASSDAFAVTLDPAAASGTGRFVQAVVLGVAVCDLEVSSAAHRYAAPIAGVTTALGSAATGPAQIVWRAGSSGTVRAVVLLGGDAGCCAPGSGSGSPGRCPEGVRLPCRTGGGSSGSGSGSPGPLQPPCFAAIAGGGLYYDCDGTGGVDVACDGYARVALPQTIQVDVRDGTRALAGVIGGATVSRTDAIWPLSIVAPDFRIRGYLTYCCNSSPPGLYFVGTVSTSRRDPTEPDLQWCGCAREFTACPPCGQQMIFGPTYDPLSLRLRLDVGCGTIDLVIGPCADNPGWQGPGYYCARACGESPLWQGPGYYCARAADGAPSSGGGSGSGSPGSGGDTVDPGGGFLGGA